MRNIAVLVILLLAFSWLLSVQAQEPEHPGRYSLHEVQPGDTLWSISEKYLPEMDPRIGVEWISEANGLGTAIIHPGDILNVPCPYGPLTEPLGPEYSSMEATMAAEVELQTILKGGTRSD